MQRIRLSFVIILTLSLALVGLVGAQDDGMKVYPQQYASVADWVAAGGADIMTYNEAPMLAERVAAGELPPVAERLPAEPAVLDPLEGIGVYGGELAGPTTSPNCCRLGRLRNAHAETLHHRHRPAEHHPQRRPRLRAERGPDAADHPPARGAPLVRW